MIIEKASFVSVYTNDYSVEDKIRHLFRYEM